MIDHLYTVDLSVAIVLGLLALACLVDTVKCIRRSIRSWRSKK